MINRRNLLSGFAALVVATKNRDARANDFADIPPFGKIPLPPKGVSVEWGYQVGNGLLIQLEHTGQFRDSFNNNRIYYFPNQSAGDAKEGIQQSSTGESYSGSFSAFQKRIYEYHSTFRMPGGERYAVQGAPLDGDKSQLSITCSVDEKGRGVPFVPRIRKLTDEETMTLESRLNGGLAELKKLPSIYERPFGYKLADGKVFLACFDDSNWPDGKERAFIGSSIDANRAPGEWSELDNVNYHDGTGSFHGLKTDQGNLDMGPAFGRQKATWNGTPVARELTNQEARDLTKNLIKTPQGAPVRPVNFPTPCGALTS